MRKRFSICGNWVVLYRGFREEVTIISIFIGGRWTVINEPQEHLTFSLLNRNQNYEWVFTNTVTLPPPPRPK
jgi:hypothetical protein